MILAAAELCYGLEYYVPDGWKVGFTGMSALTRLCEGVGGAMANTAFMALIARLFEKEKDKAMSARQLGQTIGNIAGLAVGSLAY